MRKQKEDETIFEIQQERKTELKNSKKKKRKPLKILAAGLLAILILVTAGAVSLFILTQVGRKELLQTENPSAELLIPEKLTEEVTREEEGEICYKNEKYYYNDKRVNILLLGVDKENFNAGETAAAGESGQADTLVLFSIDTDTGKSNMLSIPRDTMVDVNVYSGNENFIGIRKMQMCLAYAYGEGKEKSCENTCRSVSRLLYGVPIHSYAAIDLKAIGVLNDAIGGVEVEVLEDLSQADAKLKKGARVNLMGEQAKLYVRSRISEGPLATRYSNAVRMERQQQYLRAFVKKVLGSMKQDITLPLTLYQAAADYMVTNITASEVTYLSSLLIEHGFSEGSIDGVPGEVRMGEEYVEFYPEEEELYQRILDIFYEKEGERGGS